MLMRYRSIPSHQQWLNYRIDGNKVIIGDQEFATVINGRRQLAEPERCYDNLNWASSDGQPSP